MRSFTLLATSLASFTYVAAHGYVSSITADGQTVSGYLPFTDPYMNPVPDRVVRKIPDNGPVMDISSTDIACNRGGNVGTNNLTVEVNAGSDMTFQWTVWPDSHKGPVTTFMASCNGDCSSFTASDGKWFKIDQAGYANGQWAATELIAKGNVWTSTIPAGLASGQYLVRHEIVALHTVGSPQYYPGCVQVNVKNGGADQPSSSELTSFPGMYDGFKWPDIYNDNLNGFVVAGPNVVSFADNSPPSTPSPSPSTSVSSSSDVPPSIAALPYSTSTPAVPTSVSPDSYGSPSMSPPLYPTNTPEKPDGGLPNSHVPSSMSPPLYDTNTPVKPTGGFPNSYIPSSMAPPLYYTNPPAIPTGGFPNFPSPIAYPLYHTNTPAKPSSPCREGNASKKRSFSAPRMHRRYTNH